ncbi:MAG: aldo/keto reductase [Sphaerochaetaceae bacterium]|nr:aldo/keto reductase [Sphaerochaetaceae bacterium]
MKTRIFGNTGREVSEIGLGTWQLGTKWGEPYNGEEALKILNEADKAGITFIDTADVYNGGRSESSIGEFLKGKDRSRYFITTKCGRKLKPHTAEMYTPEAVSEFITASLERLSTPYIDLILLHCPPSPVYRKKEIFDQLEMEKKNGRIKAYGVSIEKVEDGLYCLENYGISGIEVVFNMFRLKPLDELLPLAKKKNVGIIARVPLASGLLTGKFDMNTQFGAKDHRFFNRNGESFDKGETFSGVPYETGLKAVSELKKILGTDNLAPYAIRWVLMHDEVSVVIPGASKAQQVVSNVTAAALKDLSPEQMIAVEEVYNRYLRDEIHPQW